MAVTQSIKIDPAAYALAKQLASDERRTMAAVLGQALRDYYAQQSGPHRANGRTQEEGYAEPSSSPTIPHRAPRKRG